MSSPTENTSGSGFNYESGIGQIFRMLKKYIPNDENSYSFLFKHIREQSAFAVKYKSVSFGK